MNSSIKPRPYPALAGFHPHKRQQIQDLDQKEQRDELELTFLSQQMQELQARQDKLKQSVQCLRNREQVFHFLQHHVCTRAQEDILTCSTMSHLVLESFPISSTDGHTIMYKIGLAFLNSDHGISDVELYSHHASSYSMDCILTMHPYDPLDPTSSYLGRPVCTWTNQKWEDAKIRHKIDVASLISRAIIEHVMVYVEQCAEWSR